MKYLGTTNYRLSILLKLKATLKDTKSELKQKTIKQVKKLRELLTNPDSPLPKKQQLTSQIQKAELKLEQLKEVKAEEIKLASVLILCLELQQTIGTHMELVTSKVNNLILFFNLFFFLDQFSKIFNIDHSI